MSELPRRPRVFICYMKEDLAAAKRLSKELEAAGVDSWLDKEKLVIGDDWKLEIGTAVAEADAFVPLLRAGFDAAGFRQREVRWALEALQSRPPGRGFIIPFLLERCDLPEWCKPIHAGVDLPVPTPVSAVLKAVEKHCNAKPVGEDVSLASDPTEQSVVKHILDSDGKLDWKRTYDGSRQVISYRKDMNLRFEVQFSDEGVHCQDFQESWANCHPDPSATSYWCHLYYGSSLIDRFVLVSVDGGRACLPLPKKRDGSGRRTIVLPLDYKVAQIHDQLDSLSKYMERSGLSVYEK